MSLPSEAIARDKQVLDTIQTVTGQTVRRLMPDLEGLSQGEAGGVIRQIAESTTLTFGNTSTNAAVQSYMDLSLSALDELLKTASELPDKGEALRIARGLVWARDFKPATVAVRPVIERNIEPIIGQAMKEFMIGRYPDASVALEKGVSRLVANIYRDTMATNSYNDKNAVGYQRVASPLACSFCMVVALNQYTTFDESGGYHDNCSCSAVPIFRGVSSFRPDYYDQFEADYFQGRDDAGTSSTSDILAAIRLGTGRK